jgi:hypothetical protein
MKAQVYVNQDKSLTDLQTLIKHSFLLYFPHELLMSFLRVDESQQELMVSFSFDRDCTVKYTYFYHKFEVEICVFYCTATFKQGFLPAQNLSQLKIQLYSFVNEKNNFC